MLWFKSSLKLSVFILLVAGSAFSQEVTPEQVWAAEIERLVSTKGIFPLQSKLPKDLVGREFYRSLDQIFEEYDGRASRFIPELKSFESQLEGNRGVGLSLEVADGKCCKFTTSKNSPAEVAGMPKEGFVHKIDGSETAPLGLTAMAVLLQAQGNNGFKIEYSATANSERITKTLIPAPLEGESVAWTDLAGRQALRIPFFVSETRFQVEQLVSEYPKEKRLIIDLRNNPGGSVRAAVRTACLFIKRDEKIYTERFRESTKEKVCRWPSIFADRDVLIVQNGSSASSAELFILAMRSRGPLTKTIGQQTFGKGVKSTLMNLSAGAGFLLSTSEYLGPEGEKVHEVGLAPDKIYTTWGKPLPLQ